MLGCGTIPNNRNYRLLSGYPTFKPPHNAAFLAGALHGRNMGMMIDPTMPALQQACLSIDNETLAV